MAYHLSISPATDALQPGPGVPCQNQLVLVRASLLPWWISSIDGWYFIVLMSSELSSNVNNSQNKEKIVRLCNVFDWYCTLLCIYILINIDWYCIGSIWILQRLFTSLTVSSHNINRTLLTEVEGLDHKRTLGTAGSCNAKKYFKRINTLDTTF